MPRLAALLALLVALPARAEPDPTLRLGAKSVAYFSLEMGSPVLRGQRTGGLGVLAMDLVRGTARELVPKGGSVVGVTLLYGRPWSQKIDDQSGDQSLEDVVIEPKTWVEQGKLRQLDTFSVRVMDK